MLRGRFLNEPLRPGGMSRRDYMLVDKTGSIFNPFHNGAKLRYEAVSDLPHLPPAKLRQASPDYPDPIANMYLQLPPLDGRIRQLADDITAGSRNEYDKAANIERYLLKQRGNRAVISNVMNVRVCFAARFLDFAFHAFQLICPARNYRYISAFSAKLQRNRLPYAG